MIWSAYPDRLEVSTDIVGNPIFSDFDVRRWIVGYLLLAVAAPLLTIAAWAALGRVPPLRTAPRPAAPAATRETAPAPRVLLAGAVARVALVGAVWALAGALLLDLGDGWPAWWLIPVAGVYGGAVLLAARAHSARRGGPLLDSIAFANAVAASFLLLAVAALSESMEVEVASSGDVDSYPLLPVWLLVGIAILVGALLVRALRHGGPDRWPGFERGILLYLAAPVGLFLLLVTVPGELGGADLFHEGERLTAAHLVAEGRFPWRDLLFAHGALEDLGWPSLGEAVFGESRWGWFAVRAAIATPLFWVATFLLCAWLFRRNGPFLAGIVALIVLGWLPGLGDSGLTGVPLGTQRLTLVPLTLLLLAAVLQRGTWPRALAFMAVSLATAIAVPETLLYSAAAWVTLLAYELVTRPAGSLAAGLRRTLRCAACGAALLALFFAYLAANDALDELVASFTELAGGHELTGGIPIDWDAPSPTSFRFWVFAPLVVILLGWGYAAWHVVRRRPPRIEDWVVGASLLALIPYYTRFLARADSHVYLPASLALIPVLYLAYRLLEAVEPRLSAAGRGAIGSHPLSTALLVAVIAFAPIAAVDAVGDAPQRVSASSAQPATGRVGYATAAVDPAVLRAVEGVLDRHLPAGEEMFDFTNSPELYGYFLDLDLASRYYHVSLAIRDATQTDLIAELAADPPALVAYHSDSLGLPIWDGIANPVRHYLVSDWLLDRYAPVAYEGGYVFLAPASEAPRPARPELLTQRRGCDWGFAPNFLQTDHGPEEGGVEIPARPTGPTLAVSGAGWALDRVAEAPADEVLLAIGDEVVLQAPAAAQRPDIAASFGDAALASGFGFPQTMIPGRRGEVGVYALDGGVASPISPAEDAPAESRLTLPDGREVSVDPQPATGSVDALSVERFDAYRLDLPAYAASYDWLEVASEQPLGAAQLTLSGPGAGASAITLRTRDEGAGSIAVMVGACPQWHPPERRMILSVAGEARPSSVVLSR